MTRLERLRVARDSYAVKLRDFVRIFSKKPEVVVCFFEGEDIRYYGPRIDMLRPDIVWEGVNCGGKNAVYKLWQVISTHALYGAARTAYFFDRDFDDASSMPQVPNVYVTPCYSIENLYVSVAVAKRILRAEFALNEDPDEDGTFAACVAMFDARLTEFMDAMELANAWILYHRRAESEESNALRLNLASLKSNQMSEVTLSAVRRLYTLFDLEACVANARAVSETELQQLAQTFERSVRYLTFRGKFHVHFMRTFFSKLAADANKDAPTVFAQRKRVSFNLSERNFLSDLSQHADTPESLRTFIMGLN